MLSAFSFHVTLNSYYERLLSELAELRNVILHKGAIIEQRFKDKCPWRPDKLGDRVQVTYEAMGHYFDAAGNLAAQLLGAAVESPYIYASR